MNGRRSSILIQLSNLSLLFRFLPIIGKLEGNEVVESIGIKLIYGFDLLDVV